MVLKFPRTKIRFGFRKGIKNISNASQLITVNMFPLNVTLRLFESSQHYFPWQKVNLLSSHLPTIWILVWIISVWNLKYKTIGCREIHSSVLKKSNCVKANYLGGPALISHLKIPFVSRLVFLRLSLSNKKSIIKFKCHNIQSTDSGLGPVSTLEFCIQKETKPKFSRFSPLFSENLKTG